MTDHEHNMMILGATVHMRVDACRRMVASNSRESYLAAEKLHSDAAKIAAKYRNKS